jgi:hypothetical protein
VVVDYDRQNIRRLKNVNTICEKIYKLPKINIRKNLDYPAEPLEISVPASCVNVNKSRISPDTATEKATIPRLDYLKVEVRRADLNRRNVCRNEPCVVAVGRAANSSIVCRRAVDAGQPQRADLLADCVENFERRNDIWPECLRRVSVELQPSIGSATEKDLTRRKKTDALAVE